VIAVTALCVLAASFALTGCGRESKALTLCSQAGEYVQADDLDAALDVAKQAVEAGPEDYRTWYTLGWVRSERQEYSEAEEAYRQAVALQPDSGMSRHGLGWVLYTQGQYSDAIPHLRQVARLRPGVPGVHVALGRSLARVGKHADAIAAYDRAIELGSNLASAQVGRAYSLFAMGELDEALAAAKREAKHDFSTPKLPFDLAQVMRGSGDLDGAIEQYRKSIEIDPDYLIARRELVYTLVLAGDVQSALKEAKELQGMVPQDHRRLPHSLVAWVLAYRGDVERAVASIEGPPRPDWHPGTLGHFHAILLFADRHDLALKMARDEVDWHPDDPEAHGQLALSLALAGQWQEAQQQAEEAMAGDEPSKPIIAVVLAYVLAKQGDMAVAARTLADTEEALARDGRAIETLYVAGLAYRELGDTERANELFQRAIDRWPKHPWSEKMREMMGEGEED
jgi:tetratricopeptide (TPR) repeat protein